MGIPWTGKGEATWTPLDPENDTGDYEVAGMITPDTNRVLRWVMPSVS